MVGVPRSWVDGLEARARASLPAPVHEYVAHGAGAGTSRDEAAAAWRDVRFLPHVLHDVTDVDLATEVLGTRLETPVGVAPTSLQRAVHPDGELAMARATAAAGGLMVVSSNAGSTFADIAATGVAWWLQVYLPSDRTLALPLLERAVAAGARAVVLTVDTPVVGSWEPAGDRVWDVVDPAFTRVNFDAGHDTQPGAEKALDLGPHDLDWLAERTGLPVVAKGVLRADDARRCVQAGAAAVWVSNHGGRQLDRAVAPARALPAIVRELADDDAEVYVDGGLGSGTDVLAALGLGADAAFLGRLPLWALVEEEHGVGRLQDRIRAELVEAMRLAGCRRVADARDVVGSPAPF